MALAASERSRNGGGYASTHAACCCVLHEHDEWEGERHPGKCVRAKAAEKEPVERNHSSNGKQIEDVRCGKPHQYWKNGAFEQKLCPRGDHWLRCSLSRWCRRKRDCSGAHGASPGKRHEQRFGPASAGIGWLRRRPDRALKARSGLRDSPPLHIPAKHRFLG